MSAFLKQTSQRALGLLQRIRHMRPAPKPGMDDVTLARKVETELFREADAPKASVNVTVVEGVVYLHGAVNRPDQVRQLERDARRIPEVRDVENLLHPHRTPAATRADMPRSEQRPGPRRGQAIHSGS